KVCPRREPYLSVLKFKQLVFNIIDIKYRSLAFIQVYIYIFAGEEPVRERPDIFHVFFRIYNYFVYIFSKFISKDTFKKPKIPVYQAWCTVLSGIALDGLPL